jgi:hypothetical protein
MARAAGVDARTGVSQHTYKMAPTTTFTQDRRSSRVFMRLRVIVAGKDHNRRRFREACETIVISAHGALLCLAHSLDDDAQLVLTNPFNQEEQECRVVYLGEDSGNGQRVGIEFLTPAPHFWGMEFSQPDWSSIPARHPDSAQN